MESYCIGGRDILRKQLRKKEPAMKIKFTVILLLVLMSGSRLVFAESKLVYTPYSDNQKVMFDFYFDEPEKIGSALYWIRSYLNPLMGNPYNQAPEFMSIVVIVHGTELVTLARKNEAKYKTVVDRMKYYAGLGVKFKVCALAADDFGYKISDFQDFVEVVPSAITELAHWQQKGYAMIAPRILSKKYSTQEIR
jgi:intracellular sulfur oxidation DsrE/DsrF family protein